MVPSEATLKLWESISGIGERLGLSMNLISTGGGSDGNFTAAMGVPTIDAMGPQGGRAHTEAEYLELESVVSNIQLLCEIVSEGALGNLP